VTDPTPAPAAAPLLPPSALDPVAPAAGPGSGRFGAQRLMRWLALGALALAALALAAAVLLQQRLARSERELARRLQSAELAQTDAGAQLRFAQEALRDLQARNALLEARVAETAGHQAQLDRLYQDIARNRDDWTVAEVESAVVAAAQQLQLSGNVRGALLALQDADARLAASSHPPLLGLRRVLARDIERLRALPAIDPAQLAVRIDTLIGAVDQMPMLAMESRRSAPGPTHRPVRQIVVARAARARRRRRLGSAARRAGRARPHPPGRRARRVALGARTGLLRPREPEAAADRGAHRAAGAPGRALSRRPRARRRDRRAQLRRAQPPGGGPRWARCAPCATARAASSCRC
jgi:hypothetical protein